MGILRRYWLPSRHSFGEPNWSVGDPLSAVGSSCQYPVCVWYSEELVLPQPASAPQTRRTKQQKKPGRSPKDTSRTRLGIRLLPLDLISTSFEVACGQQPIPAEGFAPSERTESRSQPRCVRAPERLSGGGEEEEKCTLNCQGNGYFHSQFSRDLPRHGSNLYLFYFSLDVVFFPTCADASGGVAADKGKKGRRSL